MAGQTALTPHVSHSFVFNLAMYSLNFENKQSEKKPNSAQLSCNSFAVPQCIYIISASATVPLHEHELIRICLFFLLLFNQRHRIAFLARCIYMFMYAFLLSEREKRAEGKKSDSKQNDGMT